MSRAAASTSGRRRKCSLLAEKAKQGLAVVYTTSEVGECLSIAHRIIVMHRGRISAEFGSDVSKEKIMAASGEAMVGH